MSLRRAALSLLALAGCRGERAESHRVPFPGFSLELPTFVAYRSDPVTEYRAGRVEARQGPHLVVVSWRAGAHTPAAEMPATIRMMSAGLPDSTTLESDPPGTLEVGGQPASHIDARLGAKGATMLVSYIEISCGARVVILYLATRGGPVRGMRERILRSFVCQPDAALEAPIAAGAPPFGADDPAVLSGWHRVAMEGGFAISNGALLIHASQRPRLQEVAKSFERHLPMIVGATGGSWSSGKVETRQAPGGERPFHHGRFSSDGEVMDALATVWHCPDRGDSVLAFAFAEPGVPLAPALEVLAKLRCAQPGDPPLPLAPAPTAPAAR